MLKKTKLVAIGGYDVKDSIDETLAINKEIIKLTGRKNPKILFIPTASTDNKKYIQSFLHHFRDILGAKVDLLLLYGEKLSFKKIQEKILSADAIYIGGGNTLRMMKYWRKRRVDTLLKKAFQKGIVLAGVSAGAICLFAAGISDSRLFKNISGKYIKVTGMGLIPAINCPHYKSQIYDRGHRSKAVKTFAAKTGQTVLAIQDGAALVMVGNQYKIMCSVKGRKAYKVFMQKEKWCEKPVEPCRKLVSVSSRRLFTKSLII